jgi:exodeoxyribonuclease V alpha subunit
VALILEGYAPYLQTLAAPGSSRDARFAAFDRFRVLCAERSGPRGVDGINEIVSRHVRMTIDAARSPLVAGGGGVPWFLGRPVMVSRNDYVLKLFNGDVGIALPDDAGVPMVWFPAADGGYRAVPPSRLPLHETAFATTVHKAQGAEFDDVMLLLPSQPSRVVTRELLYTAITRARRRATIAAGVTTLEAAIATPTARDSGLMDRLRDALTSPSSSPPSSA